MSLVAHQESREREGWLNIFLVIVWPLYGCMTWPHLIPQIKLYSLTLIHYLLVEKCHTLTVLKKQSSTGQKSWNSLVAPKQSRWIVIFPYQIQIVCHGCNVAKSCYAGVNLTSYHLSRLTHNATKFFVQKLCPGASFFKQKHSTKKTIWRKFVYFHKKLDQML